MSCSQCLDEPLSRCQAKVCTKAGCALDLSDLDRDPVVVDGDNYQSGFNYRDPLCDYLICLDRERGTIELVLAEMKSGGFDAQHALKQLQNGALIWLERSRLEEVLRVVPVILHGKGVHSNIVKFLGLAQNKITFRGKKYPVLLRRCG